MQREQRELTAAAKRPCIALCSDQFRDAGRLCRIGRKDLLCDSLRLCYLYTECQNAARSLSSHTVCLSETDGRFQKISASLNGRHHIWLVQNAGFCVAHIEVTYLKHYGSP